MRAWELAASVPWAMRPEMLETVLEVAARDGDPEAVALKLGRPLENTRAVTVRDGVAVVPVIGPLFRRANLLTQVSGATSVEVLARDLREAMSVQGVHSVLLDIDSPGGEANGVGELAALVYGMRAQKPVHAYIGGQGCSGAYWIAAACETVTLADTAQAGSIGVVAVHRKGGDSRSVEFVSSQSPYKRPDLETEEGRSQVQRVVDDIAAVFVRDVARYRGVSAEAVLSDFGGGGVLVGQAAVDVGLVDGVGSFEGVLARVAGRKRSVGVWGSGSMGVKEASMDTEAEVQPGAAAVLESGVEPPHSKVVEQMRAQLRQAEERVTALEAREAVLLASECRRQVTDALSAMRFGELEMALAPASRTALVEALMPLGAEERSAVLEALQGQQFVSLGERGFPTAEGVDGGETLTASEEEHVKAMAQRNGLGFEELKQQYLEVKRRRARAAAA